MNRILFSVLFIAGGLSAFGQDPVVVQDKPVVVYRLSTTTAYPALTVPTHIRTNFETANPGVTVIAWEPMNVWDPNIVWWRASYNTNNRLTHVYYNDAGTNYKISLPVLQTYVPDAVITHAISTHGNNIYGITKMKGSGDMDVYQVRVLDNGVVNSVWMKEDGTVINEADVYVVHEDDADQEMKFESEDQKIKIKTEDEKLKIKTEDGKTKVKKETDQ